MTNWTDFGNVSFDCDIIENSHKSERYIRFFGPRALRLYCTHFLGRISMGLVSIESVSRLKNEKMFLTWNHSIKFVEIDVNDDKFTSYFRDFAEMWKYSDVSLLTFRTRRSWSGWLARFPLPPNNSTATPLSRPPVLQINGQCFLLLSIAGRKYFRHICFWFFSENDSVDDKIILWKKI